MLPMQKVGAALLGLMYAAASLLVALWGSVVAEFHCYNQECFGGDWTEEAEAWQWDVILILALGAGMIGLVTAVVAFSTRRLVYPTVGLALQTTLVCVVGILLLEARELSGSHFLFWMLLVFGSGFALLYTRASRQRAGTRLE
jgi:glucan phosphoethanolaminetransferase (alkaline phosphatase superfamily)